MLQIDNELKLKILKLCIEDKEFFLKFKDVVDKLPTDMVFNDIISVLKSNNTTSLFVIKNELSKLQRLPLSEYELVLNDLDSVKSIEKEYIEGEILKLYELKLIRDVTNNVDDILTSKNINLTKIYDEINRIKKFRLKDATTIDHGKDVIHNIIERQKQKEAKIPTGIYELNNFLRGGFAKQELIILAGSSGKGKSNLLINFSYAALLNGNNVLHITAELDDLIVNERLNMRMCRTTDEGLYKNIDEVNKYISKFYTILGNKLLIHKIPMNEWSVSDIETFIGTLNDVYEFIPDIIVIDYIELLKRDSRYDNYWVGEGKIAEELKNLGKELDVPIVTVTQCAKGVDEKFPPRAKDLSGSDEKLRKADVAGVFCQTKEMLEQNVAVLWMIKNRNNPVIKNSITLSMENINKMIITDSGYEYEYVKEKN